MARRPPVSLSSVARLGVAATVNANSLCREAGILAANSAPERAYALSVLAGEELGKAWACYAFLMVESWTRQGHITSSDEGAWDALWSILDPAFRSPGGIHQAKLKAMLFLETSLPRMAGTSLEELSPVLHKALAEDLNKQKMRTLYVDMDPGGQLLAPSESVPKEGEDFQREICKAAAVWGVLFPHLFEQLINELNE